MLRPIEQDRCRGRSVRQCLSGAALIEVLVSILLSAVALLALASVNAAALRLGKMSQHRASATLLSLDVAERMRANPAGFGAGLYSFSADWASQAAAVPPPPAQCQTAVSLCAADDMAALDLAQWRWQVRQLLPQGAVHVQNQTNPAAGQATERVDVWIAWQEPATVAYAAGTGSDSPAAAGECPDGLRTAADVSVRCSHLRVHW